MIQELYQRAMKFAGEKHSEQKVPDTNSNYLLHISNVTMEVIVAYYEDKDFDINLALPIAILHDTLEDTSCDFGELTKEFGEQVAKAVQALTKDESLPTKKEKMANSLMRINLLEKEVGIVKLADRITNLQKPPTQWNSNKISDYLKEAKMIADSLTDKNRYLLSRLNNKIEDYKKYTVS
jgi:(p)ppGpp synthase/HD superfamily hydrolase